MCQSKSKIKLCTCGEVDRANPHWILSTKTKQQEDMLVVGSFEMPSKQQCAGYEEIASALNRVDGAFDFEYSPTGEDSLTIYIDSHSYTFGYDQTQNCWVSDYWGMGSGSDLKERKKGDVKFI
ncbi:hypothetical protein ACFO4O_00020 [Glaciecola siphonariae]|uniref:Uncharacterized protein n=1 Tax=Glaciecola siphonariae TaxID=521012 RepID=A0ABV9LSD1_9ALTE